MSRVPYPAGSSGTPARLNHHGYHYGPSGVLYLSIYVILLISLNGLSLIIGF